MTQETPEKPNYSPGQERFLQRWGSLPFLTIKGTAKSIGVSADTAYDWRKDIGFVAACDQARTSTLDDIARQGLDELGAAVPSVVKEKIRLAKYAESEHVRDSASTWLLEYVLGKREQRHELSGPNGEPISHAVNFEGISSDELRDFIARAGGGGQG